MTALPPTGADPVDDTRPAPRARLVVAAIASITAIFLTAIIVGAMLLTNQWSGRDEPTSSVDGFLQALLVDNDAEDSASYMCQSMSYTLVEVLDLLKTGDGDGPKPGFSWENLTEVDRTGNTAIVTADVSLDITQTTTVWTFAVVTGDPDNTWRVCGVDTGTGSGS